MTRWCVACVVMIAALSPRALAQRPTADVRGTVTDQTGAVVRGAEVAARNLATHQTTIVTTNDEGVYAALNLPPGRYEIAVSAPGFAKHVVRDVELSVGQVLGHDVTLAAGGGSETVIVTAGEQLIQRESSEVSGVVDNRRILNLPLNGRNAEDLILLQPGVVDEAGAPSSHGQRAISTGFILDGNDNNDQRVGGSATAVTLDAVQEFRVLTANFSAEYGRNAGAQINVVTKSGTNEVHGGAFLFLRNDALDAFSWETKAYAIPGEELEKERLRRYQWGGTLSGPLTIPGVYDGRNRTFFFAAVEIFREERDVVDSALLPTEQFVGRVLDDPRTGPVFRLLQGEIGLETTTAPATRDLDGDFFGEGLLDAALVTILNPTDTRQNRFSVKVDHSWNEAKDRVVASYHFADADVTDRYGNSPGTNFNRAGLDERGRGQNASVAWTSQVRPTVVNEARIGYNRNVRNFLVADELIGIPSVQASGLESGFGAASDLPELSTQNTWIVRNTLAWQAGRHSLKFGGEYRRTINGSDDRMLIAGLIQYRNTLGLLTDGRKSTDAGRGISRAQVATDPSSPGKVGVPETYRGYHANEGAFFVQDDWKLHPRLTLNAGLRWDYFGVPHNFRRGFDSNVYFGEPAFSTPSAGELPTDNPYVNAIANARIEQRDSDLWKKDANNFAPRAGFAWDVLGDGRTVLRGGGGVFYDRLHNNVFESIRINPPKYSQSFVVGDPDVVGLQADGGFFDRATIAAAPPPTRMMDENRRTTYAEHVFLGIQREVFADHVLEVNGVATYGHKLPWVRDINRFTGDLLDGELERINPEYAGVLYRGLEANSSYHGLEVRFVRRYTEGLGFDVNYTWSKAIDDLSFASGATNTALDVNSSPVYAERLDLELAVADFHRGHRFVASWVWELPFWGGADGLDRRLLGGWQLSGIVTLQSGPYVSLTTTGSWPGGDFNADFFNNDRLAYYGEGSIRDAIYGDRSPGDGYFDPELFGAPRGLLGEGALGRNVLEAPGYAILDAALVKRFSWGEATSIEFRVEAFNVFNRPNFDAPRRLLNASDFGRSTTTSDPRILQLGVKLNF